MRKESALKREGNAGDGDGETTSAVKSLCHSHLSALVGRSRTERKPNLASFRSFCTFLFVLSLVSIVPVIGCRSVQQSFFTTLDSFSLSLSFLASL